MSPHSLRRTYFRFAGRFTASTLALASTACGSDPGGPTLIGTTGVAADASTSALVDSGMQDASEASVASSGGPDAAGGDATVDPSQPLEGGLSNVCGTAAFPATVETVIDPGNVLVIFDQSRSMDSDFAGEPLWKAASDAVYEALSPFQSALTAGALFFPTSNDLVFTCDAPSVADIDTAPQIPFQPGPDFLAAWQARWTAANLVVSTPTERAMVAGEEALTNANLSGGTAVILVTDGGSTCWAGRPKESEAVATDWLAQGIQTYVIGLPGSNGAERELNAIAVAGGTNTVLTPADAATLNAELSRIVSALVQSRFESCDLSFTEPPDNLNEIDLIVTEAESGQRFRVPRGADGWEALDSGSGAVLQGQICVDALAGRFSEVSFDFGCENIPLI